MSLKSYHQKRDFSKTSEPKGRAPAEKSSQRVKSRRFVIQKHAASRLHWDFRLEAAGVLKSWALPKEPSMDPAVRRLAVEVEDHPLEYMAFQGSIPKGEYGGGHVEIWDSGTYTLSDDFEKSLGEGHLSVELKGKRLKGGFVLQRLKDIGESAHNAVSLRRTLSRES